MIGATGVHLQLDKRYLHGLLLVGVLACGVFALNLSGRLTALETGLEQRAEDAAGQPPVQPIASQGATMDRRGPRQAGRSGERSPDTKGGEPRRAKARSKGRDVEGVLEDRIESFADTHGLDDPSVAEIVTMVKSRRASVKSLESANRSGELSDEDLAEQRAEHRQELLDQLAELLGEDLAHNLQEELFPGRKGRGASGEDP